MDAARLHRAKARKERRQTILEGPSLLEEARTSGIRIKTVFALADHTTLPDALLVDERALQRLAGTENPRGPVAVIEIPPQEDPGDRDLLVAYGVSDPGNVGTLIRTAAAFGWAYGYTPGTADPWSPKVLRAGAGGQFQTPVVPLTDLPDLPIVATVVEGGAPISTVKEDRVVVLIGEEASGLPLEVTRAASYQVSIPTPGPTESLNAAVAAGIVLNELSKRVRNQVDQV